MGAPYFCNAPHLHARSMRAQQVAVGHQNVSCISRADGQAEYSARQSCSIIGFHLWPIEHAEPHGGEELLNLVLHLRDRMNMSGAMPCGGTVRSIHSDLNAGRL